MSGHRNLSGCLHLKAFREFNAKINLKDKPWEIMNHSSTLNFTIFTTGVINGKILFHYEEHYSHFLGLYTQILDPVAETYAWVLMPNHFHLLVRIKENIRYEYQNL